MTIRAEPLSWCMEYRLNWIKEMLEIYEFINKKHLCRKFRISKPQASVDFATFHSYYPNFMEYNPSTKQYEKA